MKIILTRKLLIFVSLCIVAIVVMILVAYPTAQKLKAKRAMNNRVATEAEQVVHVALNAKYSALQSGDMQNFQSDLDQLYSNKILAKQILDTETNVREALAKEGIFYKEIKGNLTFHRSESKFTEESAFVVVTEFVEEKLADNGETVTSGEIMKHLFILKKYSGKWMIIDDHLLNSMAYLAKMQEHGLCATNQECTDYLQNLMKQ